MATRDAAAKKSSEGQLEECFIIMPISDPDVHTPGHFRHVFDDIFAPACEKAGYHAIRADQVVQTNLIQLDVLRRIVESPMALCDLSTRNPNVLFELGLRQAFDKPVVLVQEVGTERIFDIAPFRYYEYRRELIYHQVLEDQAAIAAALVATKEAASSRRDVNSIVRLLELTQPASLQEVKDLEHDPAIQLVMAELRKLRSEIQIPNLNSTHRQRTYNRDRGRANGYSISSLEGNGVINFDSGLKVDEQELFERVRRYIEFGLPRERVIAVLADDYNVEFFLISYLLDMMADKRTSDLTSTELRWFKNSSGAWSSIDGGAS